MRVDFWNNHQWRQEIEQNQVKLILIVKIKILPKEQKFYKFHVTGNGYDSSDIFEHFGTRQNITPSS